MYESKFLYKILNELVECPDGKTIIMSFNNMNQFEFQQFSIWVQSNESSYYVLDDFSKNKKPTFDAISFNNIWFIRWICIKLAW